MEHQQAGMELGPRVTWHTLSGDSSGRCHHLGPEAVAADVKLRIHRVLGHPRSKLHLLLAGATALVDELDDSQVLSLLGDVLDLTVLVDPYPRTMAILSAIAKCATHGDTSSIEGIRKLIYSAVDEGEKDDVFEVFDMEMGETALMKALTCQDIRTRQKLLEALIKATLLQPDGMTSQEICMGLQQSQKLRNTMLNARTIRGMRPLHYAAEQGDGYCCELLLKMVPAEKRFHHVEAWTKFGWTPAIFAQESNHEDLAQWLRGLETRSAGDWPAAAEWSPARG